MIGKTVRHIAVIDIGKTNVKVALVDRERLTEIAVRTEPNAVRYADPPYPHYQTDRIWAFILDALSALNREYAIDAITVTAHGAACALLDANGALALPVLDYMHEGPQSLAAEYDAIRPPFAETGSPPRWLGLILAAQLYWQERSFPDAFAKAATILTYPQYWSFRLTGVKATEITSLGCHTDLWNTAAGDYSSLVDRLGWRPRFAPLRRASDRLGPILPEIAAQTGLRRDTPVHCGIHDSNASLLPHLLTRRPPFSVVSTGTWMVAMAIGGAAVKLDPERDTLINVNALGQPVPSARYMAGREHALLTRGLEDRVTTEDIASVLENRIFLLPTIQTGSGPFPDRKAEWRGGDDIAPGQRLAAISLYLAMMTATCLELIGADGLTITEGPFARNGLYIRMLAAATGRGVAADASGGIGTSMGAALLASHSHPPMHGGETIVIETDPQWAVYAQQWRAETAAGA